MVVCSLDGRPSGPPVPGLPPCDRVHLGLNVFLAAAARTSACRPPPGACLCVARAGVRRAARPCVVDDVDDAGAGADAEFPLRLRPPSGSRHVLARRLDPARQSGKCIAKCDFLPDCCTQRISITTAHPCSTAAPASRDAYGHSKRHLCRRTLSAVIVSPPALRPSSDLPLLRPMTVTT